MNDSSSWDTASEEVLNHPCSKSRISLKDAKFKILHQILSVVDRLRAPSAVSRLASSLNCYEKVRTILGTSQNLDLDTLITSFWNLNANGIQSRIYFILNKDVSGFLEYCLNGVVVQYKRTVDGLCFSVDSSGVFCDQSVVFSKKCVHHHFYTRVLASLNKYSTNISSLNNRQSDITNVFTTLDQLRLKKIPQSIPTMKLHPNYTLEEICRHNEIIYPKRPIFGYFKGKPVYPKKNRMKLRTAGGWRLHGRTIEENTTKPYKIHKGEKLYVEFQTAPVHVEGLTGSVMDAFHENFTPVGYAYINHSPEIAVELGIPHAECIVGFQGRERVKRGFFIEKKHSYAVNQLIGEMEYFRRVRVDVKTIDECQRGWKKFIRGVKKYLLIQKRLG